MNIFNKIKFAKSTYDIFSNEIKEKEIPHQTNELNLEDKNELKEWILKFNFKECIEKEIKF